MRTCYLVALIAICLAVLINPSHPPAVADDKPKAEPPAKAKDDKDRELHIVGIYEGFTKSDGKLHGGKAQLRVIRPGKQVTLVLVTYSPVTWEVVVNKDTKLEKVILGGYGRAAAKGLPEKVEVVEAFRGSKKPTLPFYAYKTVDSSFPALVDAIDTTMGRKIASFTGLYRAEADVLIEVDAVQDDERLSVDFPKPVSIPKLAKLTFHAHHFIPGAHLHEVKRSFGEFTLAGSKADTLKPLPDRVSRIAYDPASKKSYGISDHRLALIDMEKQKVAKIDTGLAVPEISWPADVAFDTKRDRVMLVTHGGGGHLYSYYPKTDKWEVLAEKPAQVIAYHPKDDVLYGLKTTYGKGTELQQINAKGAVVTSTILDGEFLPGIFGSGHGSAGLQLIAADDKLVLMVSPTDRFGGEGPAPKWYFMYVIDPKIGKAQLVWKEKIKGK